MSAQKTRWDVTIVTADTGKLKDIESLGGKEKGKRSMFYIYSGRIMQDNYYGRGLFMKNEQGKYIYFVTQYDSDVDALYKMSSGHPEVVEKMPRKGNHIPHYLQRRLAEPYDEQWMKKLMKHTCFHKLTYRIGEKAMRKDTFYDVVIRGCAS